MLLAKEKIQHINTISHEGKVVVIATDTDGKIWYIVKQDGFEDSYLNTPEDQRTGWEIWQELQLPNEADDNSVIEKEAKELTYKKGDADVYLLKSRYKTKDESAVAPVQLVSGLGYLYIFRQSKTNTLLVDRFVLDGLTNTLTRRLEVRFKRSKQKHKPSQIQKKAAHGLTNIDSLDFTDINGNNFYEPTTELSLVNNLANGWFSVVLLPTNEQDKYRWHIFAYNNESKEVELTTLRASDDGLFEVKDYTILDPEPRQIPGIIKRSLDMGNLIVSYGLTATKYDLQRERETEEEDETGNKITQLLRESVRVMLAVGTTAGNVVAISFAAAADGTLSEIESNGSETILRSNSREILLPLNTLDQIKAIGTTNPPPQGKIIGLARGEDDRVVLTSEAATGLDQTEITEVKITGIQDYNYLHSQVTKIDENTFEVSLNGSNANGGNWEVIPQEETGLIFNGIVTAYEITSTGKLKVTALNHGLDSGDSVQIVDTKDYNGTYTVTKVDDTTFSLDGVKWQAGTAISAKLRTEKRRGVILDGDGDYIELPLTGKVLSSDFTVEAWIKLSNSQRDNPVLGTENNASNTGSKKELHLMVKSNQKPFLGFHSHDTSGQTTLSADTWYHVAFRYSKEKQEQAIFVNGVLDKSENSRTPFAGNGKLKIGSCFIASYFQGCIADVRIWNKARTREEIKNSMYLQLTGKELGLLGYWRLDAIVEDQERKVIDFSVNGHDGIVKGDVYVSSVSLNRNLAGTQTKAIKYENEELFAVSERATYTEEFEFKPNNNVNPNNVDSSNGQIFAITCKGKKSRRSEDWINFTTAESTQFTNLANNWYKASTRFTVPDGVSMVRSFGIGDIKGNTWTTLEIRKHRIKLVSDSITQKKSTENLFNLHILGDKEIDLQQHLKTLDQKENRLLILLKQKRELEVDINYLSIIGQQAKTKAIADKEAEVTTQNATVTLLQTQVNGCQDRYNTEKNNPLNYWCKLICRVNENWIARIYTNNKALLYADVGANGDPYNNNYFKFVATNNGYYRIISRYEDRALRGDSKAQVYSDVNGTGIRYEWKPEKFGNYYLIRHRSTGEVLDRGGGDYGVGIWPEHTGNHQQWKIIIIGGETNNNIGNAQENLRSKEGELTRARKRLEELREQLRLLKLSGPDNQQEKKELEDLLKLVNQEINTLTQELATSNTTIINGVNNTQQTPQTMPNLATDSRGLVTQGALLKFVRPASRLSAIETCEGNVQLSYFDDQGRMRLTNFDATSDSRNPAFEQWIPDSVRTCLNFDQDSNRVTLERPVYLEEEWTIEAWFAYPLPVPTPSNYNSLVRGENANNPVPVIVKKGENSDLLGILIDSGDFKSSGYDLISLSPGWHHLAVVGKEDTTLFYIDGKEVGDIKATALADAKTALENANQNQKTGFQEKLTAIEKTNFNLKSNVKYIGNNPQGNKQQFGKVAEVRFWSIALSAEEIAVNSKTLLTGNEPGLLAYYPLTEATGNTVQNKTGDGNKGTITGASWWGCAAPIGKLLGNVEVVEEVIKNDQVMQFDGENDYIEVPYNSNLYFNQFTISCWVKVPRRQQHNITSSLLSFRFGNSFQDEYLLCILSTNRWSVINTIEGDLTNYVEGGDVSLNTWTHLCTTYDSGNVKLYINGTKFEEHKGQPYTFTNAKFIIGATRTSGMYNNSPNGQIAEVCIWNKERSKAEIQADMNKRLTGKEPGLVGYWPLNEITLEGSTAKVLDLTSNGNHGTVRGATLVLDEDCPITRRVRLVSNNALVSCEYSTVSKDRSAIMRRFFATPTAEGVELLPDKRIEELELKWIGNGQFAPTLLGYIEGAPPIPTENLTLEDNYNSATSVELVVSEDVTFSWNRAQDSGLGATTDLFLGAKTETIAGLGLMQQVAQVDSGFTGNLDFSYQFLNESSIASSSSLSMTDSLKLFGTQEQEALFPHLGKRFIPKNVGYALVVSATSDIFISRLKRSGKMIGYQVLPVENIPPDINTITFLINPAYTMNGSLDGLTGSSATSQRFFKHVPAMRSQFGSLYPASYYRLQEAYDLKQQIEQQDKNREAYFAQFNSLLVDETALARQTNQGNIPGSINVNRPEATPNTGEPLTEEEQEAANQAQIQQLQNQTGESLDQQSAAVKQKRAEIEQKIKDQEKRSNATASFASWQKKMEDIQIRAGKRNIVNTYVWDADGGLRTEAQSFANTAEHSIGGAFTMDAGLGGQGDFAVFGVGVELTAQATVNLTQTMTKTEARSKGIQLNVDLSGVESRGVTDYDDYPILPGEKVNRYRFMSFYLEGSTNNFHDFFK